jgi:uncharacterized integral membrane protein
MLYKGYKLLASMFSWVDDWLDTSKWSVPIVALLGGAIVGAMPIINIIAAIFLFFLCFMSFSDCAKMKEDFAGTGEFMHKYKRCFGSAMIVMLYWTAYIAWMFYMIALQHRIPYTTPLPIGIVLVGVVFIGYVIMACRLFHRRLKWERSVLPEQLR